MDSPSVQAEAANVPASAADKLADFTDFVLPEEEEEEGDDTQPEGGNDEADEGDDIDLEGEETGEEGGEPETAIEAPASLNAEEKKAFAAASPEAQQAWAAAETRRNAQVQEATTKAANAQREAESRAASADAQAKLVYAQQFAEVVSAFEPQMPDARLAQADPAQYIALKAQYDADKAQYDALIQHARTVGSEAETEADAAFIAQRDRELSQHPQIANPETRDTYVKGILELAADVGLDPAVIAKQATGSEFLALAKVFDRLQAAEAKAGKWDKAVSKQMQKVRASKGKTLRPNAVAQHTSAAQGSQNWQRVKQARSKEAQAEAFADFMGL